MTRSRKLIELCNKVAKASADLDDAMAALEAEMGHSGSPAGRGRGPDEAMRAQRAELGPRPSRLRTSRDTFTGRAIHSGPLEWYYRAYASQASALGVGTPDTHQQEDGTVRDGVWLTESEHMEVREASRE